MQAVLVRLRGPDPKGLKAKRHTFHVSEFGTLSVSCSGVLFMPRTIESTATIITCSSVLKSFLDNSSTDRNEASLLKGVEIHIQSAASRNSSRSWIPVTFHSLLDVPTATAALQSLVGSHGNDWDVGWKPSEPAMPRKAEESRQKLPPWLLNRADSRQPNTDQKVARVGQSARTHIVQFAILKLNPPLIESQLQERPCNFPATVSGTLQPGDPVSVTASPFGVLSPTHFLNCVSAGSVTSTISSDSKSPALFLVDVPCLPGMEGGIVRDAHGHFSGLVYPPLRHLSTNVELQMVVAAGALIRSMAQHPSGGSHGSTIQLAAASAPEPGISPLAAVQAAMASIVLISVENKYWGSGVVIDSNGLILTNAHLVNPNWSKGGFVNKSTHGLQIRVRSLNSRKWCQAKVAFVSRGPLDVSLLEVNADLGHLPAIALTPCLPRLGSRAFVVGFGLFGPGNDLGPMMTAGVVSRVVTYGASSQPGMLLTTAAVYSGCSGGAVLNEEGEMIALVTSNAKLRDGRVLPCLNFSIPWAAIAPLLSDSRSMSPVSESICTDGEDPRSAEELRHIWRSLTLERRSTNDGSFYSDPQLSCL